jgi:hypothetical protein
MMMMMMIIIIIDEIMSLHFYSSNKYGGFKVKFHAFRMSILKGTER